jgi:hypothetical protein
MPAEPRNSTFNKSTMRPLGFLASAESIASVSPGAVSMSTLPLTATTASPSTSDSWVLKSSLSD